MLSINPQDFTKLVTFVHQKYGINLAAKKILIEGRLTPVVLENGMKTFSEYVEMITKTTNKETITTFLNEITTNHTYFLRENEHFNYMRSTVLPYFQKNNKNKTINIWSAGCSSGQEAYTVAMVINEFLGIEKSKWKINILASDISEKAMNKGEKAVYTTLELKDIPRHWLTKYFIDHKNGTLEVCPEIKKQLTFRKVNLMENLSFARPFDLVLCRNVMIYFDAPTKDKLINKFYDVTDKGGFLFIGHSETVNRSSSKFDYVKPAIYRKQI